MLGKSSAEPFSTSGKPDGPSERHAHARGSHVGSARWLVKRRLASTDRAGGSWATTGRLFGVAARLSGRRQHGNVEPADLPA